MRRGGKRSRRRRKRLHFVPSSCADGASTHPGGARAQVIGASVGTEHVSRCAVGEKARTGGARAWADLKRVCAAGARASALVPSICADVPSLHHGDARAQVGDASAEAEQANRRTVVARARAPVARAWSAVKRVRAAVARAWDLVPRACPAGASAHCGEARVAVGDPQALRTRTRARAPWVQEPAPL
jgi:hypothetical protein